MRSISVTDEDYERVVGFAGVLLRAILINDQFMDEIGFACYDKDAMMWCTIKPTSVGLFSHLALLELVNVAGLYTVFNYGINIDLQICCEEWTVNEQEKIRNILCKYYKQDSPLIILPTTVETLVISEVEEQE